MKRAATRETGCPAAAFTSVAVHGVLPCPDFSQESSPVFARPRHTRPVRPAGQPGRPSEDGRVFVFQSGASGVTAVPAGGRGRSPVGKSLLLATFTSSLRWGDGKAVASGGFARSESGKLLSSPGWLGGGAGPWSWKTEPPSHPPGISGGFSLSLGTAPGVSGGSSLSFGTPPSFSGGLSDRASIAPVFSGGTNPSPIRAPVFSGGCAR